MNYHDLRRYLGLDEVEFEHLMENSGGEAAEAYLAMAQVSDNLEQLPGRYNRPPETEEDDPIHEHLDALSEAAFARLDALIAAHEDFRRARAEASSGRRRGGKRGRRDPLCRPPHDDYPEIDAACTTIGLRLAAKVKNLGQEA